MLGRSSSKISEWLAPTSAIEDTYAIGSHTKKSLHIQVHNSLVICCLGTINCCGYRLQLHGI